MVTVKVGTLKFGLYLIKCLKQIKYQILLLTCASIYEMPSNNHASGTLEKFAESDDYISVGSKLNLEGSRRRCKVQIDMPYTLSTLQGNFFRS